MCGQDRHMRVEARGEKRKPAGHTAVELLARAPKHALQNLELFATLLGRRTIERAAWRASGTGLQRGHHAGPKARESADGVGSSMCGREEEGAARVRQRSHHRVTTAATATASAAAADRRI